FKSTAASQAQRWSCPILAPSPTSPIHCFFSVVSFCGTRSTTAVLLHEEALAFRSCRRFLKMVPAHSVFKLDRPQMAKLEGKLACPHRLAVGTSTFAFRE